MAQSRLESSPKPKKQRFDDLLTRVLSIVQEKGGVSNPSYDLPPKKLNSFLEQVAMCFKTSVTKYGERELLHISQKVMGIVLLWAKSMINNGNTSLAWYEESKVEGQVRCLVEASQEDLEGTVEVRKESLAWCRWGDLLAR